MIFSAVLIGLGFIGCIVGIGGLVMAERETRLAEKERKFRERQWKL